MDQILSNTAREIVLPSDLVQRKDLESIKLQLLNAVSSKSDIILTSNVEVDLGLAFLQMLQSVKRKAEQNRTKIEFAFKLNKRSEELVKICGLSRIFNL